MTLCKGFRCEMNYLSFIYLNLQRCPDQNPIQYYFRRFIVAQWLLNLMHRSRTRGQKLQSTSILRQERTGTPKKQKRLQNKNKNSAPTQLPSAFDFPTEELGPVQDSR